MLLTKKRPACEPHRRCLRRRRRRLPTRQGLKRKEIIESGRRLWEPNVHIQSPPKSSKLLINQSLKDLIGFGHLSSIQHTFFTHSIYRYDIDVWWWSSDELFWRKKICADDERVTPLGFSKVVSLFPPLLPYLFTPTHTSPYQNPAHVHPHSRDSS